MKKGIVLFISFFVFFLQGCASYNDEAVHGANSDRLEGFRTFTMKGARSLEGPITDMLVPDDSPKALTVRTKRVAEENVYFKNDKNLGFRDLARRSTDANVLDVRPDKIYNDMKAKNGNFEQVKANLRSQILSNNNVSDVNIVKTGNTLLVKVYTTAKNKEKLKAELNDIVRNFNEKNKRIKIELITVE